MITSFTRYIKNSCKKIIAFIQIIMVWKKKKNCISLVRFFNLKTSFIKFFSSLEKKKFLIEIFASFRFRKWLLKTTSTSSFSNQNEPETCRFFHRFQKRCPTLNTTQIKMKPKIIYYTDSSLSIVIDLLRDGLYIIMPRVYYIISDHAIQSFNVQESSTQSCDRPYVHIERFWECFEVKLNR